MKIAFCHHLSLAYIGGGEKWVIQTANALKHKGHDVSIYALPFTMKGAVNPEQLDQLEGIPYKEAYRHKVKADVAYVTYHPFARYNFSIKGKKIAGIHAPAYQTKSHYDLLPTIAQCAHKIYGKKELQTYDAVHILNHTQSSITKEVNNIFLIPNYVDSRIYIPQHKHDEFTVAFASRKVWQKGYDIWQTIRKRLEALGFNCVESGKIHEKAMPIFLAKAHVVVNTSRVDTFGLSIIESAMCGTICLVSDIEAHTTLGVASYPESSAENFVKAIVDLNVLWTTDRGRYNELCDLSRTSALLYDKERVIGRLENMFEEVKR